MAKKTNSNKNFYDVIIIGAGPIGLMLGNLLGIKKIKALIIEKETKIRTSTRAIGVTPPSLGVLKKLNLDKEFIKKGVKVEKVVIHGTRSILGNIKFDMLKNDYKFILSIPQYYSESILESNLKKHKTIKLLKGHEAISVINKDGNNEIKVKDKNKKMQIFKSTYLCGCDGNKSIIRSSLNIKYNGARYKDTFLMADFIDKTGFNNDAHLFFTGKGPVESFPLPGGKRRWIVETKTYMDKPPAGFLENEVKRRSGINIINNKKISESPFGVQHFLSEKYYHDSIIFCGDSCHVMSPIGGQGMNTGFGDADLCAEVLDKVINKNRDPKIILARYEMYRKKAAMIATRRAWISMRIGTAKGSLVSLIRNSLIIVLVKLFKNKIPPYFSMLTIPYSTLDKVKEKDRLLFETD